MREITLRPGESITIGDTIVKAAHAESFIGQINSASRAPAVGRWYDEINHPPIPYWKNAPELQTTLSQEASYTKTATELAADAAHQWAHTFSIAKQQMYALGHTKASKNCASAGDVATFRRFEDALMVGRALQASIPGSALTLPDSHE